MQYNATGFHWNNDKMQLIYRAMLVGCILGCIYDVFYDAFYNATYDEVQKTTMRNKTFSEY